MTQGEILSALSPIGTLAEICKEKLRKKININDVNMMMPFINDANKAVKTISQFALDHFNSLDQNKRELSKFICNKFVSLIHEMNFGKFQGYSSESSVTDYFNNHIMSIRNRLLDTIEVCQSLTDILPPPEAQDEIIEEGGKTYRYDTKEELDVLKKGKSMDAAVDVDSMQYDDNEDAEETDDESEGVLEEVPIIFNKKINEEEVIKKIKELSSEKVTGKRRWYVFFRVFKYLEWIKGTQKNFIEWVENHFGWEKEKEFRGVPTEFINNDPPKWGGLVIKGKGGTPDNYELGPAYYAFAINIRDSFVNVDENGELHDKDTFLVNPRFGGIHHNTWK